MKKNYINRCVLRMNRFKNTEFGAEVERVQKCLEDPTFESLDPKPSQVRDVLQKFVQSQEECTARNFKLVPYRDNLREELMKMLRIQCDGTNYIAKGDEAILKLSGFELQRAPEHAPAPGEGTITNVEATPKLGSFKVTCKGERKHKFYEFQSTGSDGVTQHYSSTRNHVIIDRYQAGERVELRSRVVNASGEGFWSAPLIYWVAMEAAKPKNSGDDNKNMKVA